MKLVASSSVSSPSNVGERMRLTRLRALVAGALVVMAVTTTAITAPAQNSRATTRVHDEAGILASRDLQWLDGHLGSIVDESAIDLRFTFLKGLSGLSLEETATRSCTRYGSEAAAVSVGSSCSTTWRVAGCGSRWATVSRSTFWTPS